jgi:hypothetical protein
MMSLVKAFGKKVRAVRIRCGVNLLLHQAGRVLAVAGVAAALAILVERLLGVTVRTPQTLWGFVGVSIALVLIPWLLRLPSRMRASLLLDERLRLSERFSTTLALAESEDPFAIAARAESLRTVQGANLRGHFPIQLSRSWTYGAGAWTVVTALVLFMPQKDLLGFLRDRHEKQQQAVAIQQTQTEVQQTADAVKAAVKGLGDPNLAEDLRKLEELAEAGAPEEMKRQAIKALGDLSEKIKQMQSSAQVDAADVMQQMLKRLRGSADPFSQKIRMAMAKGDFAQAANMLGQLQKQLSEGTLPDEKKKEMAQQLQELAKELQKLAQDKRELEEELEKLGLDKKLAQMTPEQLQQALRKQGLKPELIEQIAQKMAACQAAQGQCSALGQAFGAAGAGAGGLMADELTDTIDQLNAIESLRLEAVMLQASLDEIGRCMGCLGQGMCQGLSPGGDNAGTMPAGAYSKPEEIQSGTKTTRSVGKSDDGPIVASWYFKDSQVKGEARRSFSEVVQAGRASAAEAISENQIPRRYEGAVKEYFSQLAESEPAP